MVAEWTRSPRVAFSYPQLQQTLQHRVARTFCTSQNAAFTAFETTTYLFRPRTQSFARSPTGK